jgi:hypothetical protein
MIRRRETMTQLHFMSRQFCRQGLAGREIDAESPEMTHRHFF